MAHVAYLHDCRHEARYARRSTCDAVPPVRALMATKSTTAADARLEWAPLAEASDGYNVWRTTNRADIPLTHQGSPATTVSAVCTASVAPACIDPDPPGSVFYYQAASATASNPASDVEAGCRPRRGWVSANGPTRVRARGLGRSGSHSE